jgi:hypothetical protein
VVGVMLGSRMDNRVEGVRGWGVPSEVIYEVSDKIALHLSIFDINTVKKYRCSNFLVCRFLRN